MATPNSKATFKEYIKRKLGAPVLEINVDDDQFEDRMDEAIQWFQEYHYDGSIKTYLKHELTESNLTQMKTDTSMTSSPAGTHDYSNTSFKEQQNYIVLPEFVLAVNNIFPFNDKHNLNMFDLRYQLRLNDIYDLTSTNILNYSMVQQHISMLDDLLVGKTPIRYNTHQNRLYLDMATSNVSAGEYIIIECYRKLDPTTFTDVNDDLFLKRYVTALFKKQWGANLSKFNGVAMLGGVTLNGQQIYTEALSDLEKLETEIRTTYELNPALMMG